MCGAHRVRHVCRSVYSSKPAKARFGSPLSCLNMRVASEMALACCFLRLDGSICPLRVSAGKNPLAAGRLRKAYFEGSPHVGRHGDTATCVVGLPEVDLKFAFNRPLRSTGAEFPSDSLFPHSHDPATASPGNRCFCTLPMAFRGRRSTAINLRGTLNEARFSRHL